MENNQKLVCYVTYDVKQKLEDRADRLGLSISAYLRYKILEIIKE